ncbi:MAG: TonB-dependent receptor [Saprospiraceae bacterium]|nr:TonB-dependent receptor [Saprospiraceae bacterium]MDZ4702708.1 TonB-dependent receptor [Saprospiraceae bacterium]
MKTFFALLISCCSACLVNAQRVMDQDTTLLIDTTILFQREVVVTAQRQPQNSFKLPVVTTVLDASYLQVRVPRSLPEALFGAPGIFLQKTNHGGGSLFLRGLTGQQTLLLVDGIRLNNATFRSGPNQYLNTLDPSWLSRVEILQSSGAVAYGSDAIGGVVNVLTRTPGFSEKSKLHPEAGFKWISDGMELSGQGAVEASGQKWAFRAGGAYRNFGDLIAGEGIGRQAPNAYRQWSVEFKGLLKLNERIQLIAAYQDLEQQDVPVFHKVQLENFKYNSFDPQRRQLVYARLQGVFDNKWWQKTEFTVSRQRSLEVRKNQKNGQPLQLTETDEDVTNGLQFNALSNILHNWTMITGAEWYADGVRSKKEEYHEMTHAALEKRGLYPDHSSMHSLAIYNMHTFHWKRLTLSGGLRYNAFRIRVPDENIGVSEITPAALVGNLGVSWQFVNNWRVYANAASAFRAPNIDDLGTLGIVDFRYELPNSSLKPEKSRSIEAGVKVKTESFSANFSAYYLQLSDLIGRVRTADTLQGYAVYRKENITEAFVKGVEAQFEWRYSPRWLIAGHTAYTFGHNVSSDEPLRRIPPFNGRLYLEFYPGKHLSLRAESIFASGQRRLSQGDIDDNRIADEGTPGWQIFNFGASYQFQRFALSGEFHNLLNEAYRTHGSGVDGVGRSFWVSLNARF